MLRDVENPWVSDENNNEITCDDGFGEPVFASVDQFGDVVIRCGDQKIVISKREFFEIARAMQRH